MVKILRHWVAAAACAITFPAWSIVATSANYNFDVIYKGDGHADVAPGSLDPRTVFIEAGDSFTWTISALPGYQWTVLSGGDVFPMMAFDVSPPANRTGDFRFQLLNDGADVLTLDVAGSAQSQVHMGTNTVTLTTGQTFDQMRLQYRLISAFSVEPAGDPVSSQPNTLLPIFGTPDNPQDVSANKSTTIYAPVPEPETWALWLCGIGALVARTRRRRPVA